MKMKPMLGDETEHQNPGVSFAGCCAAATDPEAGSLRIISSESKRGSENRDRRWRGSSGTARVGRVDPRPRSCGQLLEGRESSTFQSLQPGG